MSLSDIPSSRGGLAPGQVVSLGSILSSAWVSRAGGAWALTPGPGQRQGLGSVVCSAGAGSRAGSGAAGVTEVRGGFWNWGRADQGESRGTKDDSGKRAGLAGPGGI